ncbi:MAG: hypothetical protein MZV63_04545 [Marinilabiliales bacterium]|nr:hypothetical protein [Marinilabiliales bacterium]
MARLSTRDELLMKTVIETLISIEPDFETVTVSLPLAACKDFDMVIATGSNNSIQVF